MVVGVPIQILVELAYPGNPGGNIRSQGDLVILRSEEGIIQIHCGAGGTDSTSCGALVVQWSQEEDVSSFFQTSISLNRAGANTTRAVGQAAYSGAGGTNARKIEI